MANTKQTKDDISLYFRKFGPKESTRAPSYSASHMASTTQDSTLEDKEKEKSYLCTCWCTGWAEIHIRRPTGNTSWMMKIQNQLFLPSSPPDIPLSVLASLVLPQKKSPSEEKECSDLQSSVDTADTLEPDIEESVECEGAIDIVPCQKQRSMRRTNSSPEMNTNWSNLESLNRKESVIEHSTKEVSDEDPFDFPLALPSAKETKVTVKRTSSARKASDQPLKTLTFADNMNLQKDSASQNAATAGSFRDRIHTISVMSPIHPTGSEKTRKKPEIYRRSGMNPSFVFLHLFYNSCFGTVTHKPLLLHQTEANRNALSKLDMKPPYDTHKIGIVYVGPGQANDEVAILKNVYGSTRYVAFLKRLGNLVKLKNVDPRTTYLGSLDTKNDTDGKYALIWHDDVMQVVFHVATLMTNKKSDTRATEKKGHIGNDFVTIVFNESGEEYDPSVIASKVTTACVVIEPEDFKGNVVKVKLKNEELVKTFGHMDSYIVSDESLPIFVRQMALHANLASLLRFHASQSVKYRQVSNWLERLRIIKRLKKSALDELKAKNENSSFEGTFNDNVLFDDFTDYV